MTDILIGVVSAAFVLLALELCVMWVLGLGIARGRLFGGVRRPNKRNRSVHEAFTQEMHTSSERTKDKEL